MNVPNYGWQPSWLYMSSMLLDPNLNSNIFLTIEAHRCRSYTTLGYPLAKLEIPWQLSLHMWDNRQHSYLLFILWNKPRRKKKRTRHNTWQIPSPMVISLHLSKITEESCYNSQFCFVNHVVPYLSSSLGIFLPKN